MARGDPRDLIPNELLHAVFREFSLHELIQLLPVCQRWRDVAVDQPQYWRNLALHSSSPAEISFFLTRLERAKGRPVHITVSTTEAAHATLEPVLPATVITAFEDHLHHTKILNISITLPLVSQILPILRRTAPLLEVLALDIQVRPRGPGQPRVPVQLLPLPPNLLADNAPLLRVVSLCNVLCAGDPPACFNLVAWVRLVYTASRQRARVLVPNVFSWFPAVRVLQLAGDHFIPHSALLQAMAWRNIADLSLSGGWTSLQLPIAAVPRINLQNWHALEVSVALDQLTGPLALRLMDRREGQCMVELVSVRTGTARVFTHLIQPWVEHFDAQFSEPPTWRRPHTLLRHAPVVSRLVCLTIGAALWNDIIPLVPPLQHMVSLILSLPSGHSITTLVAPMRCQSLREVHVQVLAPQLLAEDVVAFARACLPDVSDLPLRLRVIGGTLAGALPSLEGVFCNYRSQ